MDAFAFLNDDAAADSHHVCCSTDDIRKQLDELLLSKTSETKAEHVDTKFKFPTTANFLVVVNEAENATLESAASSNGGVRPFAGHNQTVLALGNGQYQRQITTHDAIVNQPQDDPVLQRAVAKQIAGALSSPGEVASSWNVRTIARASSGWTFEYVCKDSLQVWQRQHAKEVLPVVGLSSGKDGQNPTLLSRPAFDCRGSLTIHFERTNKEIEVKYSHTPLHKTVAELYEMFTPPPEPTLAQKRAVPTTDGETATPAKKKKKKRKTGTNSTDGKGETTEGSIIVVGGPPGEIPAGDGAPDASQATPSTKKKRTPRPKKPKATVEDHSAVVEAQDSANTAASAVNVHVLDLPPGEADRRRDRANGLLVVSGIDPATLSEEQFDIFSNQSPELQRESLVMLVKYGAERLRIVHPNKDAQASTPPTPSTPASAASSAATASSDAGTAGSTTKNKKKSVKKSLAGAESGEDATPSGTKKQKLTRGKCDPCRDAKTPCSKSKPSCEQCRMADIECHYRPEVPTGPRGNAKPEEPVESKPEPVVAEVPPLVAAMPPAAEEEEPDDLPSPGFGQQSTAMDWTSTQAQAQAQAQAETTDENVSSYQSQPAEESSEQTLTTSTIEYPQHTGFASQATHAPQVPEAVMQEPAQPQWPGREVAPIHQATGLSKTGRRSLPTGQHAQPKVADNPAPDGSTSWANSSNPPPPTQPVQVQGQDTANHGYQAHTRSRSQTSSMNSTEFGFQGHAQGLREDAALSQAAIQRPSQASPPTQPSQPVRTSSRQSQRPPGSREYQSAAISNSSDYPPSTVSASYSSMGTAAQDPHAQYYGDSSSNNNNNSDTYTSTSTTQAGGSTSNDTTHSSHTSVPASNNTTVYASYDNNYSTHNVSSHRPTTQTYSNPATQATSTSYASSAASNSSNQWPSATAQVHSSKSYNNNSATAVASRTAQTASMSQSSATHGFNVRPSSPQATRSSVRASYHQQQPPSQQHLQESRSQPQTQQTRQRQPQQQQSYASYGRQQQSTSSQNQHQQQQQQGWYGYVATDSNPAGYRGVVNPQQAVNGGYDASHAGNSTSHGSQHRSMNISDNNYGHMDANDTLYSLVQNSHGR